MNPRIFALITILALAGCAQDHKLATCKGPLVALNSTDWHPTETEMAALSAACPEDK